MKSIVQILRSKPEQTVLMDRSSKQTPVRDIMTSPVMYVRPDSEQKLIIQQLEHYIMGDRG